MASLRLLIWADAAQLADYYHRNQEFHRPWSPAMPPQHNTVSFQQQWLQTYLKRHTRGEQYRFGIFTDAEPALLIGSINLTAVERGAFQNGRLGYSVDQQFANRGVITRHLQQVMQYAFGDLGLHRLEANILPHNAASRRVLEKCGFEKIGYSPKYLQIQGVWQDHELYMALAK